jgi:hypothetical protein
LLVALLFLEIFLIAINDYYTEATDQDASFPRAMGIVRTKYQKEPRHKKSTGIIRTRWIYDGMLLKTTHCRGAALKRRGRDYGGISPVENDCPTHV